MPRSAFDLGRLLHWLGWVTLGVALLAMMAAAAQRDWLRTALPVEYVRIEGELLNLDPAELSRALAAEVRDGLLFADLRAIEVAADNEPWVERAQAARVWPDTLVVRITEHRPVARWGDDQLLDGAGISFQPRRLEPFLDLPALAGPAGQERAVWAKYLELNEILAPHQLRLEGLSLSNRRAWTARVSGDTEIVFGHQDPVPALRRLLSLIPQLGGDRWPTIRRLDLRYPTGFAVVWRPAPVAPEPLPTGELQRSSPTLLKPFAAEKTPGQPHRHG